MTASAIAAALFRLNSALFCCATPAVIFDSSPTTVEVCSRQDMALNFSRSVRPFLRISASRASCSSSARSFSAMNSLSDRSWFSWNNASSSRRLAWLSISASSSLSRPKRKASSFACIRSASSAAFSFSRSVMAISAARVCSAMA